MTIRIPAEWEPHACCWMAWAVHPEWGKAVNKVKRELSEIIQPIAHYEPVRVLAPRQCRHHKSRNFLPFGLCPLFVPWMVGGIATIFSVPERNASVENDRAARLAAIPAGESPANRGVQSLLQLYPATGRGTDPLKAWK